MAKTISHRYKSSEKSGGALTTDAILAKMEHFCAYQERSPKEVREKLESLGATGDDFNQIWQCLLADGFFDEARFAAAFVRGKFNHNHWGKIRIRYELRIREIRAELIDLALDQLEDEVYVRTMQELVLKKIRQYGQDISRYDKTAASMIRAGFEPELVFQIIRKIKAGIESSET